MPYKESKQFLRNYKKYEDGRVWWEDAPNVEKDLLEFVLTKTPKNNPLAILDGINEFCRVNWMMNLGEEKGEIVKLFLNKYSPKTILELGGYCGFSALLMAFYSSAIIHTIQPNQQYAAIAHQIHQHAGLSDKIIIHIGVLQTLKQFVGDHGKFDFIFIDHVKGLYLKDLLELDQLGVIKKGSVVVGDNIICPGSPDYHNYFRDNAMYESTLYHSYLEYTNYQDAVLVSQRILQ